MKSTPAGRVLLPLFGIFLLGVVFYWLKTGKAYIKGSVYYRDKNPFGFWFSVALFGAGGVAILLLSLYLFITAK